MVQLRSGTEEVQSHSLATQNLQQTCRQLKSQLRAYNTAVGNLMAALLPTDEEIVECARLAEAVDRAITEVLILRFFVIDMALTSTFSTQVEALTELREIHVGMWTEIGGDDVARVNEQRYNSFADAILNRPEDVSNIDTVVRVFNDEEVAADSDYALTISGFISAIYISYTDVLRSNNS